MLVLRSDSYAPPAKKLGGVPGGGSSSYGDSDGKPGQGVMFSGGTLSVALAVAGVLQQ